VFGKRLRTSLEERYGNIRAAGRGLREADVSGASYSQLRRYIDGSSTPTVDFVREVAREVNVRPEWLAFGSGAMRLSEEVKGGADLARMTDGASEPLFRQLVQAIVNAQPSGWEEPTEGELAELAAEVQDMVLVPVSSFANNRAVSRRAVTSYVLSLLAAMLSVVPEPAQGPGISEQLEFLRGEAPGGIFLDGADDG